MPSILVQLAATPLNSSIIILCSLIWFYMWNRRITFEHVSISYRKVIDQYQYYRIITAAFTHLDLMHILFNMSALWSVGSIEIWKGSLWYIETTILLIFLSKGFWLTLMHILINRFNRTDYRDSSAVGYSGVIFGWMTILLMLNNAYTISLPGDINLPFVIMPFLYLVITKILLPRSSFTGHLAGILAGYLISWNLFDWLRGYWLWSTFSILMGIIILSLSANQALPSFLARCIHVSPEYIQSNPLSVLHNDTARSNETVHRIMDNGILRVHRPLDRTQITINSVPLVTTAAVSSSSAGQEGNDSTTIPSLSGNSSNNTGNNMGNWLQGLFTNRSTARTTVPTPSLPNTTNTVNNASTTVTRNPLSSSSFSSSSSSSQGAAALPTTTTHSSTGTLNDVHTTIDVQDDEENDNDNYTDEDTQELLTNRPKNQNHSSTTGTASKNKKSSLSFLSRHI